MLIEFTSSSVLHAPAELTILEIRRVVVPGLTGEEHGPCGSSEAADAGYLGDLNRARGRPRGYLAVERPNRPSDFVRCSVLNTIGSRSSPRGHYRVSAEVTPTQGKGSAPNFSRMRPATFLTNRRQSCLRATSRRRSHCSSVFASLARHRSRAFDHSDGVTASSTTS